MLIPFVVTLQFIFLHTAHIFSCLLLYSFCDNFVHSVAMWETLSVRSPQSLQRGDLTWYLTLLVLKAFSFAAQIRASVSTFKSPVLKHLQDSSFQLYRAFLSQTARTSLFFPLCQFLRILIPFENHLGGAIIGF